VAEWLGQVSTARGVDVTDCLRDFRIEQLRSRSVRSLDEAEARAVEVAALLSVPELAVVALFEPSAIAPLDLDLLHERLRGLADDGACVVIATGAPEDLGSLPDHVYLLEGGKLWGRDEEVGWAPRAVDPEHQVGVRGIAESVSVWLAEREARRMASRLNERSEVSAVRWGVAEGAGAGERVSLPERLAEVVVSGPVLESVALAVASVVDELEVEVVAMHHISLGMEGMRAAARAHRASLEAQAPPAPTAITPPAAAAPEGT
jgi:energy-coupling factor transporter ATP-binding protein EcfA2